MQRRQGENLVILKLCKTWSTETGRKSYILLKKCSFVWRYYIYLRVIQIPITKFNANFPSVLLRSLILDIDGPMFLKNVRGWIASGGALYSIHKTVVKTSRPTQEKVYFAQENFHRNLRVYVRVYMYICYNIFKKSL